MKKMVCKLWVACPICAGTGFECMHRRLHDPNIHCNRTQGNEKFRYIDACNDHDCIEVEVEDGSESI